MDVWDERLKILENAIEILEEAVDIFHSKLGNPAFISEVGKERFEYKNPSSLHFQFLKAVRIVSGLNAIGCLFEKGYTQEIGVLTRTIYDFIDEINYVQETHETGNLTAGQKKIVDDFFSSRLKTAKELLSESGKRAWVTKREIITSMKRIFGRFCNPERIQKLLEVTHHVYSGYVHGYYAHIMELCEGNISVYGNIKTKFRLRGSLDTPHIEGCRDAFAGLIHRSLNTFGLLAMNLNLIALKDRIITMRKEIENKGIYNPRSQNE